MGSPLCLTDPVAIVIADTGAVINLLATGCAEAILRILPNRLRVVDTVVAEVDEGRRRGHRDAGLLNSLVAAGLVEIVTLSPIGEEWFESLVIGHAMETLPLCLLVRNASIVFEPVPRTDLGQAEFFKPTNHSLPGDTKKMRKQDDMTPGQSV